MPSIIEGYNYDIFISYRQKDNKGDKWVSKFVEALKTELEATFKEDISVYFDENPHDRLQETHNVDKSLEGKLKCLIFIPILSQTYCDPNSYAWQYEFLAFNKFANEDHFGRDVRLRSGNVASRILPVRIHDLEPEDVKLFEKETGNVLRAMDFVFKTSSGVNRPLKADEDHPQDNLNKTFYTDQINKVAHAIKEIILGMKTGPVLDVKERDQVRESFKEVREEGKKIYQEKPAKSGKRKLISTVAIVALLIIAGIIAYPKIFKKNTLDNLRSSGERISIAVMPFQNMTNDTSWNVWQDGIQFNLITSLSNYSDELKVSQTESINGLLQSKDLTNYASITPSVASNISQKLDASVFICGNINEEGTTIRVNAQLIDSKTEEVFKSFQIGGNSEQIMPVIDSLSALIRDFLLITILKKNNVEFQKVTSTNSPLAYKYFILGKNANYNSDYSTAIKWFKQAIEIDSNFTWAMRFISTGYLSLGLYDEGKKWCLRIYKKRNMMSLEEKLYTDYLYAQFFETPYEAIKYLKQLQEIDNQSPPVYRNLGGNYARLNQREKAILEYEKALEIYRKWDSKPLTVNYFTDLGGAYHVTGQYKKEGKLYKKAEHDFPNNILITRRRAILSLTEGDTVAANQYIEKLLSSFKDNSASDVSLATNLARIYLLAGIPDKVEEYYRKVLLLQPENPSMMDNLGYFLIDKDRNIKEGLELINKAIELNPDNYNFMHDKGWGLYKQGKYQEALEILQKSWDLRREKSVYNHEAFLHLEEAKKAVAGQKNN
jgi:tetratricopeptide (TPR) repeat protein